MFPYFLLVALWHIALAPGLQGRSFPEILILCRSWQLAFGSIVYVIFPHQFSGNELAISVPLTSFSE